MNKVLIISRDTLFQIEPAYKKFGICNRLDILSENPVWYFFKIINVLGNNLMNIEDVNGYSCWISSINCRIPYTIVGFTYAAVLIKTDNSWNGIMGDGRLILIQ